ncbi:MAG: hypothetical protein IH868_07275 [Chloroflexi bacterium]|nr:hypothetical protein [Chloroflexota bacterium]
MAVGRGVAVGEAGTGDGTGVALVSNAVGTGPGTSAAGVIGLEQAAARMSRAEAVRSSFKVVGFYGGLWAGAPP